MKKFSKRVLSLLLAMLMLVSVMPAGMITAQAKPTLYWPVPNHTSLSPYRNPALHDYHAIDIQDNNIKGAYIIAAIGGTVYRKTTHSHNIYGSNNCSCDGQGTGLVIIGTDGRYYEYSHMKAESIPSSVKKGSKVSAGQIIGQVGNTGNSHGSHLHFGITNSEKWWGDPNDIVDPQNENYYYSSFKYNVNLKNPTNIKNTSATIGCTIKPTALVQKWGYYISTSKSAVQNIDGTDKDAPSKLKNAEYHLMADWNNSPKSKDEVSGEINKYAGKSFRPKTTYYYKCVVKINDRWFQSGTGQFTTKGEKPGNAKVSLVTSKDIGIGDNVGVTWTKSTNADSYTLKVLNSSGAQVGNEIRNIKSTTYAIPNSYFTTPDTYIIYAIAVNTIGTTALTGNPQVTVHDDLTVTFYDTVDENGFDRSAEGFTQEIESFTVHYGHDSPAPSTPSHEGYTFKGWNVAYTKVVDDLDIIAKYKANLYNVKFVDGYNNKEISSDKYEFGKTLGENDYPSHEEHENYEFVGWSEENYTVKAEAHTIYASYKWALPTDITASIVDIKRAKSDASIDYNDGYSIDVKVTAPSINTYGDSKTIKGRVIVALKTSAGRLLIETESSAFVLYPKQSEEVYKTVNVFVPYESAKGALPTDIEAYVVNNYSSAGVISNIASNNELLTSVNEADNWLSTTETVEVGKTLNNGLTVAEIDPARDFCSYTKTTTTTVESLSTEMNGYTLIGTPVWVNVDGGPNYDISYVNSWPTLGNSLGCGFDNTTGTGKTLYNTYNKAHKTAYEGPQTRITVPGNTVSGYIYYHWCRNNVNDNLEQVVKSTKRTTGNNGEYKYHKFHVFFDTTNHKLKTYRDSDYYKETRKDICKDSFYWFRIPVYKQRWYEDRKVSTFQKIETTSVNLINAPINTVDNTVTNASIVTTTNKKNVTIPLNKNVTTEYEFEQQYYVYKPTSAEIVHQDTNIINDTICGEIGAEYKGKTAVVYIYKGSQVSDYTTEYISTVVLGENGSFALNDIQTREAISQLTGDFTVAVSVEGETNAIVVDKIIAPKPEYEVIYYDYDGSEIYNETVEEGGTVTAPSTDLLTIPEGFKFTGWSLSTVGVNNNLKVYPLCEEETYVVSFVDWENRKVETKELKYGEIIEHYTPNNESAEGTVTMWDLSNCQISTVEEQGIDEETNEVFTYQSEVHIVTGNTVICSYSEPEIEYIAFISPDSSLVQPIDSLENDGVENIEAEIVDRMIHKGLTDDAIYQINPVVFGDRVETPLEIDESDDYIFYGWVNVETGEYLEDTVITESATYYPVFEYAETTAAPVTDVETGEYSENQTVTISCETEDSVIYYTTDGSDPKTSETAVEYSESVVLTKSCVLKAYAVSFGRNNSSVISKIYAINTSTSGSKYHLVTVYSNLDLYGPSAAYQALIRETWSFDDSIFEDVSAGYNYGGLFLDENYSEQFYADEELITDETVLYAKYSPKNISITFVDFDETEIATVSHTYGEELTDTPVPSREGYVFLGWEIEDFSELTEDTVVHARYCLESEYATVELNRATVKMVEGNQFTKLRAIISPVELSDTELTWSSSDNYIAEVDENGIVTALNNGTVTITVYVNSTGERASCEFTILGDPSKSIVLSNSFLVFDNEGYIRMSRVEDNSVANLVGQFDNVAENLSFVSNGVELTDLDRIGTGTVVKLSEDDGTVLDRKTFIMTGDLTGDGVINNRDVAMLNRFLVNKIEIEDYQALAVDVNGDGTVNNRDATMLARYLVGKEVI